MTNLDDIRKKVLASVPQAQHHRFENKAISRPEIKPLEISELEPEMFPKRGSSFEAIVALAYTFDGYAHYGMERCAELANAALSTYYHQEILPEEENELRACLFFEARRWSLYESMPDTKANIYIFALIDKLRANQEGKRKMED